MSQTAPSLKVWPQVVCFPPLSFGTSTVLSIANDRSKSWSSTGQRKGAVSNANEHIVVSAMQSASVRQSEASVCMASLPLRDSGVVTEPPTCKGMLGIPKITGSLSKRRMRFPQPATVVSCPADRKLILGRSPLSLPLSACKCQATSTSPAHSPLVLLLHVNPCNALLSCHNRHDQII